MEKSVLEKRWMAYRPKESNGYWCVETVDGYSVCTCYIREWAAKVAKQIVKDHNEMLKINKAKVKAKAKEVKA